MNPQESGFLLLTCKLGNPDRKVLTVPQLRTLARRVRRAPRLDDTRDILPEDLISLGYSREFAGQIVSLLEEEDLLERCLTRARRRNMVPLTWVSAGYPAELKERLGEEAPGCLWALGDLSILEGPKISLVGSRELRPENLEFAREAGRQAALQGYILVSGNARGADTAAQESCLASGGRVISIVADALDKHQPRENLLYLSEQDFDEAFSSQRALSRNRCIHALGSKTLVAQSTYGRGGTWDGTVKNLRHGWSSVFCFDDAEESTQLLCQMGATAISMEELGDLATIAPDQDNFLDRQ